LLRSWRAAKTVQDFFFVVTVLGAAFALALAAGLFLAARYGRDSSIKRRTIVTGTVVVAAILVTAWVLLSGMGVCC